MNIPKCRRERRQPVSFKKRGGKVVGKRRDILQGLAHPVADLFLRDAFGERIHRHDTRGMDGFLFDELKGRVLQLQPAF